MCERSAGWECKQCEQQSLRGEWGYGLYSTLWFCSDCWEEWRGTSGSGAEDGPLDVDACEDLETLRREVRRLRSARTSEQVRIGSPCTDVEHWSSMEWETESNRWRFWQSWCPCCKRPLDISTFFDDGPQLSHGAAATAELEVQLFRDRFAYVAGLWGANAGYALGALVLGCSLRRSGTPPDIDLVLMHTDDVPESTLAFLAEVWILQRVDFVDANSGLCGTVGTL